MGKPVSSQRSVRFGAFEVDLASAELRKRGRRVKLERQPFQVLGILAGRPGELVTREELRNELWPENTFVEFDHSLNTAVKKIRQALEDSPRNSQYIETVPRQGYRFIAAVESAGAVPSGPPPPKPRLWYIAAVVLVIAPAIGAIGYFAAASRNTATPAFNVIPLTTYPGYEYTPSFSPDGLEVAFTWCREGRQLGSTNCGIYIKQIGEEKPFRLADGPGEEISPAWSPDGGHIAFVRVSSSKQA